MGGKAKAIVGAGAVGVLAVLVLLFMFIPQKLIGGTSVGSVGETIGGQETKEVTPYRNTLDMHIGRVIVSYDMPSDECDVCLNAVSGLANDNNTIYVHGVEKEGVKYTMYMKTSKTQKTAYAEVLDDGNDWESKILNRVVYEENRNDYSID